MREDLHTLYGEFEVETHYIEREDNVNYGGMHVIDEVFYQDICISDLLRKNHSLEMNEETQAVYYRGIEVSEFFDLMLKDNPLQELEDIFNEQNSVNDY